MKELDSTDPNKIIGAFDQNRFFDYDELYSHDTYIVAGHEYHYQEIDLNGREGVLDIQKANDLWDLYSDFFPLNLDSDFAGFLKLFMLENIAKGFGIKI